MSEETRLRFLTQSEVNSFERVIPLNPPEPTRDEALYASIFLPVEKFPLEPGARQALYKALNEWTSYYSGMSKLTPAIFLEVNKLPLDEGASKVSANGSYWLPSTGLGVFPDQPPPRLWTDADFLDRDYGSPLPPMMHTVFAITGGEEASKHVFRRMLGSGASTYVLVKGSHDEFLEHGTETLLPTIQAEALTGHPFYVPLLSRKGVREADTAELEHWLGPAQIYIRESVEESGVLIVSSVRGALDHLLTPLPHQGKLLKGSR